MEQNAPCVTPRRASPCGYLKRRSTSPLIVEELAVEIEEVLPLRIAIANDKCIRPAVERIAGIDDMCPAFVALRQQDHVAVAADPHIGPLGADRLGAERHLPGRGNYLWLCGEEQWNARFFACARGHRERDVGLIEVGGRLEALRIVSYGKAATCPLSRVGRYTRLRARAELGKPVTSRRDRSRRAVTQR